MAFLLGTAQKGSAASQDVLRFIPNIPSCGKYEYSTPKGAIVVNDTYCEPEFGTSSPNQLIAELERVLAGHTIRHLYMSFFAVTDPRFSTLICEHLSVSTQTVVVGTRRGQARDLEPLLACARKNAVAHVTSFERGTDKYVLSFHLKLLAIERDDGQFVTIGGSMNPTRNAELNVDYFIRAVEKEDENYLYELARCVVSVVAVDPMDVLQDRLSTRNLHNCFTNQDVVFRDIYEVDPFILPIQRDLLLAKLGFLISGADEIKAYTQSGDYDVFVELFALAKRAGKIVEVTMDDDTYYFANNTVGRDERRYMSNEDEEQRFVVPLLKSGVQLKFVPTNHHDQINFMHAKFITFWRRGKLVQAFVGSPNLTGAAYTGNMEIGFLVRSPRLLEEIETFSKNLDKHSLPYEEMPSRDMRPRRQ